MRESAKMREGHRKWGEREVRKGRVRDGRRCIIYGRRDCKGKRRDNKGNMVENAIN